MTTLLDETYAVPLDTARAGSVCAALATEGVGFRHEPWPNLQPSQAEVFGQEVCDPSARTASSERFA